MENSNNKMSLHEIFSLHEDSASHEQIRDRLLSGGRVTGPNMIVMICSIAIASLKVARIVAHSRRHNVSESDFFTTKISPDPLGRFFAIFAEI